MHERPQYCTGNRQNLFSCSVFIVAIADDDVGTLTTKPRLDALETALFA